MRRNGVPDPAYVDARRVLLDVLGHLHEQGEAMVLIGAQAIYRLMSTFTRVTTSRLSFSKRWKSVGWRG